jgi:hypothetical protein
MYLLLLSSACVTVCCVLRTAAYMNLVGRPEGRKPLGRRRNRWEDNIKMDLQEVGWWGAWTGLIWLKIGTGGRLS